MAAEAPTPVTADQRRYRHVLGHFPTGVVVVTASAEGTPVGLAIGSFASVSLDPAMIGFFPSRASATWPRIHRAGDFAVNVLGEDQAEVCRVFATNGADKFASLSWRPGGNGAPVLDGVIASIECEIADVLEAGDHWFVLGRVQALHATAENGPLVFFRGSYTRLG